MNEFLESIIKRDPAAKSKLSIILTYPGAILCEFKVESDLCLPLVPPGAALDDIITKRKMDKYEDFHLMEAPN